MSPSLLLALWSAAWVCLEAFLAYQDGMLFPSQMVLKYPVGFPFIANGGMWGDLFLVTPTLYIVGKYVDEWEFRWVLVAITLGMTISYAMHYFVYLRGALPDSLAGGGRPISPAGWMHVVYFGIGVALVGMFYFGSMPTTKDVVLVGFLLALHIIVANHVPFYFVMKYYHFPWSTNILENGGTAFRIIIVAFALLAGVTISKLWW